MLHRFRGDIAPLIGCTLPEYYFSAEKMCELEEYIYNKFHSDGAGLSTTLRGMAEAMGSKIKYSDYNIAQLETLLPFQVWMK